MGKDFDEHLELPSQAVTRAIKGTWKAAVRANDSHVQTGAMRYNWKLSKDRRSSHVPKRIPRPRPSVPKFKFRVRFDERFYLFNNMPYAEIAENLSPGGMMRSAVEYFKHAMTAEFSKLRGGR